MTDKAAPDPFDKVAAREAELAEAKERREKQQKLYGGGSLGSSVSFFVMLLLLLPLHWMLPHDAEWLLIIHMVMLAIAGGEAFGTWIRSRGKKEP